MSAKGTLLSELKRRKVVRVAVVYAATAFVVLQVAELFTAGLGLPEWFFPAITVFLILGFPVALVLAWALELTPEGLRVTPAPTDSDQTGPPPSLLGKRTVAIAGLLVALGAGLGAGWILKPGGAMPADAPLVASLEPLVESEPSIAVLPFVNMSDDAANEFFADGISEELLNVLVKVDDIGVASRTSSFAYKGRELGAVAIARELNVVHILEGSVRKAGNRVRITAQLIDAVNDRHLWSETYDRELTDIFAIQDEIANAIVAALRGTLGTDRAERAVTVRADTENMDAYELYLKARELFLARSELVESVRMFERAVELDPGFARGWEGLAEVAAVMQSWQIFDRDYNALALHAAERALEIDPSLATPWAVRSLVLTKTLPSDYARALELMDRAIEADPRNATAYLWRSIRWIQLGFFDRAVADQDRCLAMDPAYQNCRRWKAMALQFAGDSDAALELFEQGVASGLISSRASMFVDPLLRSGQRTAALLLMRDLGWPVELQQAVLAARLQGTPPPDARALVEKMDAEYLPRMYMLLRAYDLAGEPEISPDLVEYWDPAPVGFRATPAFKSIVERLGVAAYWREHGFPPQCRPVGARDFECT